MDTIQYRTADANDLSGITALLEAANLPVSDIHPGKIDFIIASAQGNEIVGCIGIEKFGADGLLRSFAVNEEYRNLKIGSALYDSLLTLSFKSGIQYLHLLTTTAENYFSSKGFIASGRDIAPDAIKVTAEFSSLCPASSVYMRLHITPGIINTSQ